MLKGSTVKGRFPVSMAYMLTPLKGRGYVFVRGGVGRGYVFVRGGVGRGYVFVRGGVAKCYCGS